MQRLNKQNKRPKYDIIVIGGGISGASVAYEAASRGMRVALVEKNDFANATSSATSKMIHGGTDQTFGPFTGRNVIVVVHGNTAGFDDRLR